MSIILHCITPAFNVVLHVEHNITDSDGGYLLKLLYKDIILLLTQMITGSRRLFPNSK